jgi:hypothetical protein
MGTTARTPVPRQSLSRVHFPGWLLWHDLWLWRRRDLVDHFRMVNVIFSWGVDAAAEAIRKHIQGGLEIELAELRKSLARGARA